MPLRSYAKLLTKHPFIVLFTLGVVCGTCLVLPFVLQDFPNFEDPQKGFETRGTEYSDRTTTWKQLLEATSPSGLFVVNPKEYFFTHNISSRFKTARKKPMRRMHEGFLRESVEIDDTRNATYVRSSMETLTKFVHMKNGDFPLLRSKPFFCGPPDIKYAHIVFKSTSDLDLFNLESLLKLCHLQEELANIEGYKDLCVPLEREDNTCCEPWSLVNYVAWINERNSCIAITEKDVQKTKNILKKCAKFYHRNILNLNKIDRKERIPFDCIHHDAVFNIMKYLTSTTFLPPNNMELTVLKETMVFLPMACSTATMKYYQKLESKDLTYEGITAVAMEFGLKNALFDKYLLEDMWFIAFGTIFIVICLWIYTETLFLTIVTITAIVLSLGISFFLYTLIFELGFFPFMNLLTVIVAIGIGSDDAFVFMKVWTTMRQERDATLMSAMTKTMYHAAVSMLITSVTTSVAFFSSYCSSVTAIRCFGIFAGTSVVANYFLMITIFPAAIIIQEEATNFYDPIMIYLSTHLNFCFCPCLKFYLVKIKSGLFFAIKLCKVHIVHFLDTLNNYKGLLFILFNLLTIASSVVVFYYPKLRLPESNEFQLFATNHPFEQYDLNYKGKFEFSKDTLNYKLPLHFVWGVLPRDNGNHMDPHSLGELELDETFDISVPESQEWLLQFCRDLKSQPFYQPIPGSTSMNCFIENLVSLMDRRCEDPINENESYAPCCKSSPFPYEKDVFDQCIVDAVDIMYRTPVPYFMPSVAGPRFSKDENTTIEAIVIEFDSTYSYTTSFNYMKSFIDEVDSWMKQKMETAPEFLKFGWFVTDFEFYDLQNVLKESTFAAVGMSMVLSLMILFVSTLNVLISLYAVFTITSSIITTMAILVLSGWSLNILESVAISSSVGLTVDFCLHFSIHYKMCPLSILENRVNATRYALANMLGPVTMAAITTGAAGAFMIPSRLIAYKQVGVFLVTVMSVSWAYATFHLSSMLAIAGPQNKFGQYSYKNICRRSATDEMAPPEGRPAAASITSESHELQLLTGQFAEPGPSTSGLRRSVSGSRIPSNQNPISDQSPSATSAITIIMAEDN